jgi:hypothetical protein
MLGKIIGAMAGAKIANHARGGIRGPGGALLGAGAVAAARRLGPLGLVAGAAGAYLLKRHNDKVKSRTYYN